MDEYLDYYKNKMEDIKEKLEYVQDEKEKTILQGLLKGYSYTYSYMASKLK